MDPARIGEYSLVILNDAGQLSGVLADNLTKFVNAGGQLIVAAGPHTEANSFNSSLRNISPAELRELVQTRAGEGAGMSEVKFEHPIFEVFQQSGRLASAHVNGYFRSEARPSASVLARFEDGSPALLESRVGKGRVLLFTSTLGPAWNDLPLTPLYLPFVHQMVRYTGEREASPWYGLGQSFTVKKDHQGTLPAVDSPSGVRLSDSQLTQEGDVLLTAREPGFYRLRYEKAPDFAAVDIDGAEGDFTKLNFAEFMAGIKGGSGSFDTVA